MEELIHDNLTRIELELKKAGFKEKFIRDAIELLETDTFHLATATLAEEHITNYLRYLNNKVQFTLNEFILRRKRNGDDNMWEARVLKAKEQVEQRAPNQNLIPFLKNLMDESLKI